MKNILKLTSLAMIFCGLASLSSCKTDGNEGTPASPTNLEVSNVGSTMAAFSWTGTPDATSYDLSISGRIQTVTETAVTIDNLTANTEYTWRVRANYGTSSISAWTDGTAFTTDPVGGREVPAPTNLTTTNLTYTSVTLSWEGDAARYRLIVDGSTISSDITEKLYSLTDLSPNTTYQWSVTAYDEEGKSSKATAAEFTTDAPVEKITVTYQGEEWNPAATSLFRDRIVGNEVTQIYGRVFYTDQANDKQFAVPSIFIQCLAEPGTYPATPGTESLVYGEYYSDNYWGDPIFDSSSGVNSYVGDWAQKSGSWTTTSIGNGLLSGTLDIVLEDNYVNFPDMFPGAVARPDRSLKVVFENARYTANSGTSSASATNLYPRPAFMR